jgi:hypothetical protein
MDLLEINRHMPPGLGAPSSLHGGKGHSEKRTQEMAETRLPAIFYKPAQKQSKKQSLSSDPDRSGPAQLIFDHDRTSVQILAANPLKYKRNLGRLREHFRRNYVWMWKTTEGDIP